MTIAYLLPNGAGSQSDYTPVGDTPNWKCVDDPVGAPDDEATYIKISSGQPPLDTYRDYFTHVPIPAGEVEAITSVKVCYRGGIGWWSGGDASTQTRCFLKHPVYGEIHTENYIFVAPEPWVWTWFSYVFTSFGFPWGTLLSWADVTPAILNNAEFGIRMLPSGLNCEEACSQLYLEIDYVRIPQVYESSCEDGMKVGDAPVESLTYSSLAQDGIKLNDLASGQMNVILSLVEGLKMSEETVKIAVSGKWLGRIRVSVK